MMILTYRILYINYISIRKKKNDSLIINDTEASLNGPPPTKSETI